ncbi:MAG: PepSY-associated TM helix domain-containing protein [Bacteroidota bacterium]
MGKRNHNVFFHLHTVSGIVISVGLYIIFFAGAFTLFEKAIHHWEEGEAHATTTETIPAISIDYDRLTDSLQAKGYDLYGRSLYITLEGGEKQAFFLSGSTDSLASEADRKEAQLSFNTTTYEIADQPERYSFGSLLYLLHFFYQLDRPGYYLSGAVALFFLFALITGLVIHWKKIVLSFYVFRPGAKLKTIWTDAHTALGTIGIPFQFMYALTGAMFGLGVLVGTSGSVLYEGDTEKFYAELYGEHNNVLGERVEASAYRLNPYADSVDHRWADFAPKYIGLLKLESENMQFRAYGYLDSKAQFLNNGEVVYDVVLGKVNHEHNPYEMSYAESIWPTVSRLHYADYGNLGTLGDYTLKFIYFILAVMTCFVIISGVLIWLEARNKRNVPEKERRYNERVGHIYLAICLSMLPMTALTFIVAKLIPVGWATETFFNSVFFGGWLLLSVFFWRKQDNYFTNRYTLLASGALGMLIPLVNGLVSGHWIWRAFLNHQYEIFIIDVLWLFLATICLFTVYRMKKPTTKVPIQTRRKRSVATKEVFQPS